VERVADIPRKQTHAHELARLLDVFVSAPAYVLGDFGILRVLAKDRLSICQFYFPQS
jgi:hypothetical protein